MMNLKDRLTHPIFRLIGEVADEVGQPCYIVGGYVRDLFLHRASGDIDFVTVGSGIGLAERVAERLDRKTSLAVYRNFGTAQLKYRGLELEFVGARKESYRHDSRKPIVENGTLDDDQKRRDFTINALAVCLNAGRYGELVDPFGGVADIGARIIRTPLDPDITFSDDPLRMMRRQVCHAARLRDSAGNIRSHCPQQGAHLHHFERAHSRRAGQDYPFLPSVERLFPA